MLSWRLLWQAGAFPRCSRVRIGSECHLVASALVEIRDAGGAAGVSGMHVVLQIRLARDWSCFLKEQY